MIKPAVGLLLIRPLNFVPVVDTVICSPLVSCVKNLGFSLIVYSLSYGTGTGGRSITSLSLPERVLLVVITSSVSNSTISTSGDIYSSLIRYSPSGCCRYPMGIIGRSMGSSSPAVSYGVFCSDCVVGCGVGFDVASVGLELFCSV